MSYGNKWVSIIFMISKSKAWIDQMYMNFTDYGLRIEQRSFYGKQEDGGSVTIFGAFRFS